MDQLLPLSPQHFHLLIHPHPTHLLLKLAASLAQRGPLTVFDGGNSFNIYTVAGALRRNGANVQQALGRILVARAFTCYQMAALICQAAAPAGVSPPAAPLIVLDLLSTFQDENVPLGERKRLLKSCLPALRQRCQSAPILVSIRQELPEFMSMLMEAADDIWQADPPPQPPLQGALWAS
jgi:hypothetical protein